MSAPAVGGWETFRGVLEAPRHAGEPGRYEGHVGWLRAKRTQLGREAFVHWALWVTDPETALAPTHARP